MLSREKMRKFSLYFNTRDPYFEKSRSDIDDYDIEFEKFIDESTLYNNLDEDLIPMKKNKEGENYYFISLIISYALAHLQRFLRSENENSYMRVINSINFLKLNSFKTGNYALLRAYNENTNLFDGEPSAMDNGMAISLTIRAYLINKDKKILEFCSALVNAYFVPIEKGGFTRIINEKSYWFDEFPLSNQRVLNGKLFALLGLLDYKKVVSNKNVDDLIGKGYDGLSNMLCLFDRKWWSNYFVGRFSYISSAKYHSLHILQLNIVGNKLKSSNILIYAEKFKNYDSNYNRILSGFILLLGKIKMIILK